MSYKKCGNCCADEGLHHYETRQCPKNGIEEWRLDKKQEWENTTFVDAEQLKLEKAAPLLYKELEHLVKLLEPLEQSGSLDVPGLATLNGARNALKKAIE